MRRGVGENRRLLVNLTGPANVVVTEARAMGSRGLSPFDRRLGAGPGRADVGKEGGSCGNETLNVMTDVLRTMPSVAVSSPAAAATRFVPPLT